MLNTFPELLVYSLLAPLILRVVIGIVFIDIGFLIFKKERDNWINTFTFLNIPKKEFCIKIFGGLHIIFGLLLVIGLYTQISALMLSIITFIEIFFEYKNSKIIKRSLVFYMLVLSITISLLLSGAGAFAFDLPL